MENSYHASSFEDAFFHVNREFINKNQECLKVLRMQKILMT